MHFVPSSWLEKKDFCDLERTAVGFCTGARSLIDNTGLIVGEGTYGVGEVVELFCMVSGLDHIEYLEKVAYPALISTDGFEDMLKERKVIYNFYTTLSDVKYLENFISIITEKGISYRLNTELLSYHRNGLYSNLCLPIIDQVKRSLALRSVVVMALPDAIFAGPLYRVIKDMKEGEEVVCAMPRIDASKAYPSLKRHFADTPMVGLVAAEMVQDSMGEFLHPQTYAALNSASGLLRYRDQGGFIEARNALPPPLCFFAREEMLETMIRNPGVGPSVHASFYTIDHDFTDSAWRSGQLRIIDDSEYFFWVELTGPNRHHDFQAHRLSERYYTADSMNHIFQTPSRWIYDPAALSGT